MKEKRLEIELIRIIGIVLVIYQHTGVYGFFSWSVVNQNELSCFGLLFLSIASKIGAPLFFMVSGCLLIPKEETLSRLFFHRILRMILVLLIFSGIQYGWLLYTNKNDYIFIFTYFIKRIYSDKFAITYWYIYMYIAILNIHSHLHCIDNKYISLKLL